MDTITAIKPLRSDPSRCSVRVGKRTVATLAATSVKELGLEPGVVWDDRLAERVNAVAATDGALRDALRIINRRMIGSTELADRLKRKGYSSEAIGPVVERLKEKRFLDDEAYARAIIGTQRGRKPIGDRLLKQKLYQKRLGRSVVEEAVRETGAEVDHVAEARRLAEQKLRSATLAKADPVTRKRRIWSLLARRGFDHTTIEAALRGLIRVNDGYVD